MLWLQRQRKKKLYDFVSEDGIRHRVFEIKDVQDVKQIEEAFDSIQEIYIADGHHRAASAVKVGLKEENKTQDLMEQKNLTTSFLFFFQTKN